MKKSETDLPVRANLWEILSSFEYVICDQKNTFYFEFFLSVEAEIGFKKQLHNLTLKIDGQFTRYSKFRDKYLKKIQQQNLK